MKTPLRIALVSAFPPGRQSLNEYGLHLAKALSEQSDVDEILVFADKLADSATELDLGPKVRVQRVWTFNGLSATYDILAALRREKVDAVLWNLQTATFGDREIPAALGLFAPAIARVFGVPSGVIAHNIVAGIDLENTHLKGQRIRQNIVRLGGAIVTHAILTANYITVPLRGYYDELAAKSSTAEVHLIPHGTFETETVNFLPVHLRPKRIVTMGKFGTYKRLETLLDAFDILRDQPQYSDYELSIGGSDHPSVTGYMESVAASRVSDPGVHFLGYVAEDDIAGFFGNARLSIFDYSATTGSSGVLHQTASYGAVPVFPRIGDFVDLCRDEGLSGVHYSPLDAADMARAMTCALSDPRAAQTIANENAEAARELPISEVVKFHVRRLRQGNAPIDRPLRLPV